jgi:hypothetical protein
MKRGELEHVLRAAGAPADLAISKLAAWREKDRTFVRALLRHGIVGLDELRGRLDELDTDTASRIEARLRGVESEK